MKRALLLIVSLCAIVACKTQEKRDEPSAKQSELQTTDNVNTYTIFFDEIAKELQVSSHVYIRGMVVGHVQGIELMDNDVKVTIAIEEEYADMLTDDCRAVIRSGVMGSASIHIEPGTSTKIAPDGSTLNGHGDVGGYMLNENLH
jgi:ABC-type transporter Mla subunit MlaD